MARRLLATAVLAVLTSACGCCSLGSGPMFPRLWAWRYGATVVDDCAPPCCDGPVLDGCGPYVVPAVPGPAPVGPPPPAALVPAPVPQSTMPPLAPAPRLVPEAQQAQPKSFTPMKK